MNENTGVDKQENCKQNKQHLYDFKQQVAEQSEAHQGEALYDAEQYRKFLSEEANHSTNDIPCHGDSHQNIDYLKENAYTNNIKNNIQFKCSNKDQSMRPFSQIRKKTSQLLTFQEAFSINNQIEIENQAKKVKWNNNVHFKQRKNIDQKLMKKTNLKNPRIEQKNVLSIAERNKQWQSQKEKVIYKKMKENYMKQTQLYTFTPQKYTFLKLR